MPTMRHEKAFAAVNEEGAEATAATAVMALEKGIPEHAPVFLTREIRAGSDKRTIACEVYAGYRL